MSQRSDRDQRKKRKRYASDTIEIREIPKRDEREMRDW